MYVDETGQDPRSEYFIVAVVVVGERREALRQQLRKIERVSRKGNKKWTRSTIVQKTAYCAAVTELEGLPGRVFCGRTAKPTTYLHATTETIRLALDAAAPVDPIRVVVLIDGLEKSLRHRVAVALRSRRVRIRKVRGIRDESDEFIRLADAIAGLARSHLEMKLFASQLYQQ